MGTKQRKFISISVAILEIKNTLLMQSELNKREELGPLFNKFENFQIRKGTIKVHPLDFVSRPGLWIKFNRGEKFYCGMDLVELFLDLLSSKPAETVSEVYSEIECVKASVSRHPKTSIAGLLVETEMEKFKKTRIRHWLQRIPRRISSDRS